MKNDLLNTYNLLLAASEDYNHPHFADRHGLGPKLYYAAMQLRRLLNAEVVVNNESMSLVDYCSFAVSAIVQFEDNWRSHAGDESWPNEMAVADWDENFLIWLTNETKDS